MTEREAQKIATKEFPGFPLCKTLEKGNEFVFLLSGGKGIPDGMIVAVTGDGKVGASLISEEDAKENTRR